MSFSFDWLNCWGVNDCGVSYEGSPDSESISWVSSAVCCSWSLPTSSDRINPLKIGIGNSSECRIGRIADGILEYEILPLFFCQYPLYWPDKIAVSCVVRRFSSGHWKLRRVNPYVFLLSSHAAFPRSYDTQYVGPISCLGHQEQVQNTLYKHASQTMLYYAFDE